MNRLSFSRANCGAIVLLAFFIIRCDAEAQTSQPALFPGDVRLVLPPVIYATPGVQTSVYFDSCILAINADNYAFDVTCPKGNQLDDCWTWTPKPDESGEYPLTIEVRDQSNKVIARARTTVRVANPNSGGQITFLAFGDSHLQKDTYMQTVLDLSKADASMKVTLIGSRGRGNKPPTDELRHEGYNGWTAEAFATRNLPKPRAGNYVPAETGSPFVYVDENGKAVLDFAQYCRDFNNGQPPDFVLLELGTNDIWSASDETIDATIDKVFGFFDQLIAMVHTQSPNTRMGIVIPCPLARSQYGFRNYAGDRKQTRWQRRRDQQRMVERETERYGNREAEKLFLIPAYVCIDPARAFVIKPVPVNSRITIKEDRVIDGVHLSPEGYMQLGDEIYSWIKCGLAKPTDDPPTATTRPSR